MLVYTVSVSRSTSKCVNSLIHLFLSRPQSGLVWVLVFCFQTGSHYVSEASLEFCPASISQLLGLWACTTMLGFISFCLRQGLLALYSRACLSLWGGTAPSKALHLIVFTSVCSCLGFRHRILTIRD